MNAPLEQDRREMPGDEPDPAEMAIHEATDAIHRLYDILAPETAHWLATVAIINADRNARARR